MNLSYLPNKIFFYTMLAIIAFFCLFPFYYGIITSFTTGDDLFRVNYIPPSFSLQNYVDVFSSGNFGRSILNSVMISATTVIGAMFLAVIAAYALARVHFKGRGLLLMTILSVSMFPPMAILPGLFELVRAFGVYDTPWAMIISYTVFTLPFTIWVLTVFVKNVPVEIEEAAIIDGATPMQIVLKVFLPLLKPAIVTTGLLAFIGVWNEFLFVMTFVVSPENRTVPLAISMFSGRAQYEIPWGIIMAASVVVTLPLVGLVLVFQKKIVSGLTVGAVKG